MKILRLSRPFGVFCLLSSQLAYSPSSHACTTLSWNTEIEQAIIGKNYDFPSGDGYVMVNKRRVSKKALLPAQSPAPAEWTSLYGSVTFNQFGRELPLGGMNEAGLVVEVMVLETTNYGRQIEGEQAVNEAQWIQYQLDNFASVAEVIKAQERLRIMPFAMKLHYLVCDAQQECATVEFLAGKVKIATAAELQLNGKRVAVLANSTYQDSTKFLREHTGFGGQKPLPQDAASLSRFARAATWVQQPLKPETRVDQAYAALKDLAQGSFTKWHIVYNPTQRSLSFQPSDYPGRKWIYFSDLDFSCEKPVLAIDINADHSGNINNYWQPLTREENHALLKRTVSTLPVKFPDATVEAVASYPFVATKCGQR